MTIFAFFFPYKFEATTFTLIELKRRTCFSALTFKRKPMPRHRIGEAHEWVNEIPSVNIHLTLWIGIAWHYSGLKWRQLKKWRLDTPVWCPHQGWPKAVSQVTNSKKVTDYDKKWEKLQRCDLLEKGKINVDYRLFHSVYPDHMTSFSPGWT